MTINIDADSSNADWTKTTPDLQMSGPELVAFLKETGTTVEHFKTLPVYTFNRAHFDKLLKGGDMTLTDAEYKRHLTMPQAQFVPAVWPGQEPVDGDRAAELLRLVTLGEPQPADLTPAESAMWARQAKGVAEAKAKGLTVDFPNE